MRYEDRSNLARIADLTDGVEASLDLYVRVAGGFQVGKNRGPKAPPLYIFEVTASDPERTGKPVVVKWFVSGRQAGASSRITQQRFQRGARFVAFGKWEWDARSNTFALMLTKPDELEMLPGTYAAARERADPTRRSRSGRRRTPTASHSPCKDHVRRRRRRSNGD